MEPKERLKSAAMAAASDIKVHVTGEAGEKPTEGTVDTGTVEVIIKDWPAMSRRAARLTIDQYGPPNEATASRLIWYNNGPWKRTIAYRDEIPHDFPEPHTDVLEQFINYRVPPEKLTELGKFDGSIIVDRTKGEVSSRCHMEPANILGLNLMHDIVTGKMNVEQARQAYAEISSAYMLNRPAPYAERLQFEVPIEGTVDTDEVIIGDALVRQTVEKVRDMARPDQ